MGADKPVTAKPVATILPTTHGKPRQVVQTVPLAQLRASPLNERTTRDPEAITQLAGRMRTNGFDQTRVLKAVKKGAFFEVFAGETRHLGAAEAGLKAVPVCVYYGLSDEEIVRLSIEDNDNDELHVKVGLLDKCASCAKLYHQMKWPQEQVAAAVGSSQETVSLRIKIHRELPPNGRDAVREGVLDEGGCVALLSILLDVQYLAPWLTSKQARSEAIQKLVDSHRGKTGGHKITVRSARAAADRLKATITAAEEAYDSLAAKYRPVFVRRLAEMEARSVVEVHAAHKAVVEKAAKAEDRAELDEEARHLANEQEYIAKIQLGDARKLIVKMPEGAKLLLSDPPYGVGYHHKTRRKIGEAKKHVEGDADPSSALQLVETILKAAAPRMAEDAHALVFTGWRYEPAFREVIEKAGWTVRQSLVWVKHNHGIGDTATTFAPQHERIIYAIRGRPVIHVRHNDVLYGKDSQNSDHPTEKPRDLLHQLIEATTLPGDLVVDPFAGSGNTLLEALTMGRDAWGCEIDKDYHTKIAEALLDLARGLVDAGSS